MDRLQQVRRRLARQQKARFRYPVLHKWGQVRRRMAGEQETWTRYVLGCGLKEQAEKIVHRWLGLGSKTRKRYNVLQVRGSLRWYVDGQFASWRGENDFQERRRVWGNVVWGKEEWVWCDDKEMRWPFWRPLGERHERRPRFILFCIEKQDIRRLMGSRHPKNRRLLISRGPKFGQDLEIKALHRSIHLTIIWLNRFSKPNRSLIGVDIKGEKKQDILQGPVHSFGWALY